MAGIYIHVPFCKSKCSYCDFYSRVQTKHIQDLVDALCKEIHLRATYLRKEHLSTIYFGGGTPSILTIQQLSAIFEAISQHWDIAKCQEITLEANPDDLSDAKLRQLASLPINRLSIGIQSLNDNELSILRRRHTASAAIQAVKLAQKYYDNISLDLMYGLPEQSISSWEYTISTVLALNIQHISAYHLTYEAGTLLERKRQEGIVKSVDEQMSLKMYETLVDMLASKGIVQYEISNFALPQKYSRHNSSYWEESPYLGIGPSAHSFDVSSRQWNPADLNCYIEGVQSDKPYYESEILSVEDRYNEMIMISLRTAKGLSLAKVRTAFGDDVCAALLKKAQRYIDRQIMKHQEDFLALTAKGLFLSDGIILDLMLDL